VIGKVRKFFGEVKVEMSKVTWSSRAELVYSTAVVLVAMAFLSVFIGFWDLVFSQVVNWILK
jgi:preprotein translocase subunit SecE